MNDLTGKELFLKNAAVSWSVHILIIIAGFIVPRQIDNSLGPVQLGIWDLGWASVQYMTLTGFGVGSALNRYIGLYRASGDSELLIKITTAAFVWQAFVAILILTITIVLSWSLPYWAKIEDPAAMSDAQIVLFLLGLSLAIKMLFDHTGGILTGYHLWWMLNGLIAFQDFILAILMVSILLIGGNLVDMAITVVFMSVVVTVIRYILVRKNCPEAVVNFKKWESKLAIQLLRYGVKNIVGRIPQVLIFQTAAMLLIAFVNPAALALFNRGVALIRQVDVLIKKIVRMFVPMTSSLIGLEKKDEARGLLIQSNQLSMCLTLPGIIILSVFGDVILGLWMGQSYAYKPLMVTLALGALIPIGTSGTHSVMAGFNAHGKMSLYGLLMTVIFLVFGGVILNFYEWSVLTVTVLCAVAWTAGKLLTLPYFLKKNFKIGYMEFFRDGMFKPVIYNLILIICFGLARELYEFEMYLFMVLSMLIGMTSTLAVYWKYLFNDEMRREILRVTRLARIK